MDGVGSCDAYDRSLWRQVLGLSYMPYLSLIFYHNKSLLIGFETHIVVVLGEVIVLPEAELTG
jgi:hypothetical protein